MSPEETLSIYGSHDASVTFIDNNKVLRIYEYERFVKKRYAMFSSRFDDWEFIGSSEKERESFLNHIFNNLLNKNIKNILYLELNQVDINLIKKFFPNAEFIKMKHHFSHAASGFYTSNFESALIFSIDGGGLDLDQVYTTRAYIAEKNKIQEIECPNYDLGNPYSAIGWLISELNSDKKTKHSLSNAGKVMGLCAYGNVRVDWAPHFEKYYETNNLHNLCFDLGIKYEKDILSGEMAYDVAATSQYFFEKKMDNLIFPLLKKHKKNVVLVGGCALNVLYNQKLYEHLLGMNLDLHIPSNPNDCGESLGMFLTYFPEFGDKEICYNGIEILDEQKYVSFLKEYPSEELTMQKMVSYLKSGKIFGIINDFSEVGPRALGNRSIICDPSFPEMKNILNSKVKFREWYRPFAPVCKLQDADKYFISPKESKYMSYAPKIKEEYKNLVKSIVHQDNTTRLQTVTIDTHLFFYNLLCELEKCGHIPIILNTSFNIKGMPILTTYEDAFYVLENTQLDFLIIKDRIFRKK